jgi:hypothetical protein
MSDMFGYVMGGVLEAKYLLRARQAAISSKDMGHRFIDLDCIPGGWTAVGTSPVDASERGGALNCVTGAGASATSGLSSAAMLYDGAAAEKFYVACRMRVVSAMTATMNVGIGLETSGLFTGNDHCFVGGRGATSTTLFSAKCGAQTANSTIAVDTTSYHVFELWCDGDYQYLSVDDETPVAFGTMGNPGGAALAVMGCQNGSGGGAKTARFDWALWCWDRSAS